MIEALDFNSLIKAVEHSRYSLTICSDPFLRLIHLPSESNMTDVYSEPFQTSKIERFSKIVNGY